MLILASASPRRHELLDAAGIEHLVQAVNIPETRLAGEPARSFVQRLAAEKARAATCSAGDIVLAADTVVCVDGEVFGKPVDAADATRMLRRLSGRDHWVYTGISLRRGAREIVDIAATRVHFVTLTEEDIAVYVSSGEPSDKAGAYAIQGLASRFISGIDGSYQNVVGLPIALVYKHLKSL